MSPDLIAASLALVAALVWATRGDARALRDFVEQHADLRESQRPRPMVSAQGRPISPFTDPLRPRAIEWVDAELLPDDRVERPALEQFPVIVVDAHDVDPLPARPQPPALRRRPRAIEPRRRAIDPPRGSGDRGAVTVHGLLVAAAGLAVFLVVAVRLAGAV